MSKERLRGWWVAARACQPSPLAAAVCSPLLHTKA